MMTSLLVVFLFCVWPYANAVTVDTTKGQVVGQTLDLHNGKSVNSFLGIPFAKGPGIGNERRWEAPEEMDPWEEPFIADEFGPACPQPAAGVLWLTHPGWNYFSEDCLNLNVFTPADQSGAPYPVMYWIHGGAFQSSANIQYPGYFLAAEDVVVVVINYRLGIIGFASTDDDVCPGNYGLLDQIAGLQWVQDNILAFGGDPNMVTIFGQSAGGGSVGHMILSPLSEGLFHQAIFHSGNDMAFWAVNGPLQYPGNMTRGVGDVLGCPTEDSGEMMDCLRGFTPRQLREVGYNCSACLGFAPVVDGEDGVLPDLPGVLREEGRYQAVPTIAGMTREDGFIYFAGGAPESLVRGFNRTEFESMIFDLVTYLANLFPDPEQRDEIYEAILFYYSPWPHIDHHELNREMLAHMVNDFAFGYPLDLVTRSQAQVATTYQYVFAYVSDNFTMLPSWTGCFHMLDLPFVFGFPLVRYNDNVRNETGMVDIWGYTEDDDEYAEFTMELWTNFAKYGNPTPEPVDGPAGLPATTWEEYTPDDHQYLLIDKGLVGSDENFRSHEFSFWTYYLNKMVLGEDAPLPPSRIIEGFHEYLADSDEGVAEIISGIVTNFFEDLDLFEE